MSETFDARSNDRIAESVRLTEERFISDGVAGGPDTPPYFAKITALAQDESEQDLPRRAKGILFYYDSDAFEYLEVENGWIFDDDSEDPNRTGDIYSETDLTVGDIVEVLNYHDRTATGNQMAWLVRSSGGGGAERPIVNILELVDESEQLYTGDIFAKTTGGLPLNPEPVYIKINVVYQSLTGSFIDIFGADTRLFSDPSTMEDPEDEEATVAVYFVAVAGFA